MDAEDFEASLTANFAESGFVTSLPAADPHGKSFLAICKREGVASISHTSQHAPTLSLTVTDCLSGIFRRRFGFTELMEMRREVGMAEFAWGTFLKLLATALRGQGGCSAVVELKPSQATPSAEVLRMHLILRFQLQAAALVTRVDLGTCTDGPSASPGMDVYLCELHNFIVGAVAAAGGNDAAGQSPQLAKDGASQSQSPRLSKDALQLTVDIGATVVTAGADFANLASANARKVESLSGSTPGSAANAKIPAPKKRTAGSLVDPHARRLRGAGANPFQLSRANHQAS